MGKKQHESRVEQIALEHSGRQSIYPPTEKIRIIEVENFPLLGKLTATIFRMGTIQSRRCYFFANR